MYNYRKHDSVRIAALASDTDTINNLNSTYRLNFCAHSIDTGHGCTFCKTYSCNWDNPAWVKITLNFLQCIVWYR